MPPNSWFCPKLTRGWRSAPVKSVLSERANRQSQRERSSVVVMRYIEDNDDDVYMLKMRLELLGNFEVLTAEDGEKGCEVAAAEQPDIRLGGRAASERQLANPEHSHHRSVRTCAGRRAREGDCHGVRRV